MDYPVFEHDVIVIGAGGAGLRAAIEASAAGVSVGLICKSLLGKAHTVMAEGGVAAALGPGDPHDHAALSTAKSGLRGADSVSTIMIPVSEKKDLHALIDALPPAEVPAARRFLDLAASRSLPNAGFFAVMGIVIAANMVFGVYFYAIGAWPVIGFCGLDVFLVWLAFKLSYRQGRLHERVRIAGGDMRVSRALPSGHESRWRIEPFWARVVIDNPASHEARVRVVSKGRSLVIGSFLSPDERMSFGKALGAAIARARSGGTAS